MGNISLNSPKTAPPRVLLVGYGGGHIRMLLPLALRMRAEGWAEPFVMALTTAAPVAKAAGFEPMGFADLIDPSNAADLAAVALGAELASDLAAPPVDPRETHAYLGLSYQNLVCEHGKAHAKARYASHGRQCFHPVQALKRAIERWQTDLVIATNSPRAERAAIDAAGQLGVKSLCLVDLFALDEVAWIGKPGYADEVAVLSEGVKRFLVEAGRNQTQVHVTGNPSFDTLHEPHWRAQGQAYRAQLLGGDAEKKLLLFATSAEPSAHPFKPGAVGNVRIPWQISAELGTWLRSNPGWQAVVKAHPSHAQLLGDAVEGLQVLPADWPLPAVLHAADAVLIITSTVAVEATLLGKPVLRVWGSLFDDATPFEALGFAKASCNLGEVGAGLSAMLVSPVAGSVQGHKQGHETSNATERVCALIQRMLAE